jgi:hypothetical protein
VELVELACHLKTKMEEIEGKVKYQIGIKILCLKRLQ